MTCPVCGATMTPRLSNGQKRTVCSKLCATRRGVAASIKRNDRAEDVADLLAAGESPQQIVARIGVSAGAVARSLHRAGRHDLGRIFDRVGRAGRHAA